MAMTASQDGQPASQQANKSWGVGPDQTKEGQASSTDRTELRGVCDVCLSQLAREVEVRVYALTQRAIGQRASHGQRSR